MKKTQSKDPMDKYYALISKGVRAECEKERGHHTKSLESFEAYCAKKEKEVLDFSKGLVEVYQKAIGLVLEGFTSQQDKESIQEMQKGAKHFSSMLSKHTETDLPNLLRGKVLNEFFGYRPELLEKIYQTGLHLLGQNRYDDASKVFGFLILLDPTYSANWISLGVSQKLMHHWEDSLRTLEIAMKMDEHNPLPYYHAAECYKELGRNKESHEAMKTAKKEAHKNSDYAALEKVIASEHKHR